MRIDTCPICAGTLMESMEKLQSDRDLLLGALNGTIDAMLRKGVFINPNHPDRQALSFAENAVAHVMGGDIKPLTHEGIIRANEREKCARICDALQRKHDDYCSAMGFGYSPEPTARDCAMYIRRNY